MRNFMGDSHTVNSTLSIRRPGYRRCHKYPFVRVIPYLPSTQRNEPFAAGEPPTEYWTHSRPSGSTAATLIKSTCTAAPLREPLHYSRSVIVIVSASIRTFPWIPLSTTPNPRRGGAALPL